MEICFGKIHISLRHCSLSHPQLSLFLCETLGIYFALKSMSADAILLSKCKKNTWKRFSGGSEHLWSLRGKMMYSSGSKFFGCFKKHPKVVSGALRDGFWVREVFRSFEKRTPGLKAPSDVVSKALRPCSLKAFVQKRHIPGLADFQFLQDWANFWQTDLFWHEKRRSIIVSVDLCFVFQK